MNLDEIPPEIFVFKEILPRFPDGRIDYHDATEAAVLNCFLAYNGKLLLVKRSDKVGWLKGRWHVIAGFLDEEKTLRQKALEEVQEETGIGQDCIASVRALEPVHYTDEAKHWIVYNVIVELSAFPKITLDWESPEYEWVEHAEVGSYGLLTPVAAVAQLIFSQ